LNPAPETMAQQEKQSGSGRKISLGKIMRNLLPQPQTMR
jgi:hypothetical protein